MMGIKTPLETKSELRQQFQLIKDIWSKNFTRKSPTGLEKIFLIFLQFLRCLSLSNFKYFFHTPEDQFIPVDGEFYRINDHKGIMHSIIERYVLLCLFGLVILLYLHTCCPLEYFIVVIILLFIILLSVHFFLLYESEECVEFLIFFYVFIVVVSVLRGHPFYLIFGYLLSDILSANLGIIFIDRYKGGGIRSLNRTLILIGINYLEIIVAFAILYLETKSIEYCHDIITNPFDALYFSAVTITSLGCSDMKPISLWGKALVGLEPIIGLVIVVIIIGEFFTLYGNSSK